jgi:hypothetical protein
MRADNWLSAALVLALQAVLLFEACASADWTIAVLFVIVTFGLSIPGYMWSFERPCPGQA